MPGLVKSRLRILAPKSRAALDPRALRGAAWAVRALRDVRGQLEAGVDFTQVQVTPPPCGSRAFRGGRAVLRRSRESCLVRSIVRQRLLAAADQRAAVVVGMREENGEWLAHAWLDNDDPIESRGFTELARRPNAL